MLIRLKLSGKDLHVRTRSNRVEFKGLLRRLGPNSSALNIYRVIPSRPCAGATNI